MTDVIVQTSAGVVRGSAEDGVARFLGIPYAAAPFGAHRFAAPAPVAPWDGVRDAVAFGPTAPKLPYPAPLSDYLGDTSIDGDGCLNLNVWTPDTAGDALPVMVWVHGGSLRNGSSSQPVYDGRAFARDGVVLVSVNYRLGVEGFGHFPDAPANRGLLDVVAALQWVRREIAAFGGDPDRVTVAGQSAGANIVAALLGSPPARGLFRRAVLQSGPPTLVAPKQARRTTALIAKELGVPATAAAMAGVDRDALLDAQRTVTSGGDPITGSNGFGIVVDEATAPAAPLDAVRAGASAEVDLLVGSTTHEHRLWFVPGRVNDRITPLVFRLACLKFRIPRRTAAVYRGNRPAVPHGEVLGAIATDLLIRVPLLRIAEAAPARTHVYEFAWSSTRAELGACHALELGFVFDTLDCPEVPLLAGEAPPQTLADEMHAAWVGFVRSGDPGWESWQTSHAVRRFETGTPEVIGLPREDEVAAMGGLR